ncbi:MAG TPA: MlaD family protein [Pirellulales bacterium]|jgi:phospholipid/cholesterol/gamma-HCH transport system substrate-binding protein|nr:MlaD family protein [Pirellulales bacterium]
MDERLMQFRVGVMALATLLITASLVLLIGKSPSLVSGKYTIYIKFDDAPGVSQDTPIRKFGIRIGRVAKVGFADDGSGAIVTAEIDADIKLRRDEYCRINNSLLGDAVLEFIKNPEVDDDQTYIAPGDVLKGTVRSDPFQVVANLEGNLSAALKSVDDTSDEIGVLARRLSDLLGNNDEQFSRIVTKTEQTLDQLKSTIASADDVLRDPVMKENLKRAINDLPQVVDDARDAIGNLKTTLGGVDRNLANLEGLTKPLGDRGPQLVANIESSTATLDKVLRDLAEFSDSLDNPNGSFGQLVNNPELYQQINSAVGNFNQLSKELRPIVKDVRIFTDKLARHPEQLGVRGALKPSNGLKKSPSEIDGIEYGAPPKNGGLLPWTPFRQPR